MSFLWIILKKLKYYNSHQNYIDLFASISLDHKIILFFFLKCYKLLIEVKQQILFLRQGNINQIDIQNSMYEINIHSGKRLFQDRLYTFYLYLQLLLLYYQNLLSYFFLRIHIKIIKISQQLFFILIIDRLWATKLLSNLITKISESQSKNKRLKKSLNNNCFNNFNV
ncbi:hypothetical protein pb186bvf_001540 [Paramecium bursaria]